VGQTAIIKGFSGIFSFLTHRGHKLGSALSAQMASKYMKNSPVFPEPVGMLSTGDAEETMDTT
jgi:hypothetical protein